jgi:hypothetical protein
MASTITSKVLSLSAALLLAACGGGGSGGPSSVPPDNPTPTAQSLVIAPMMAGTFFCEEAIGNPAVADEDAAARYCASLGRNGAARIGAALDAIGPKTSPSGAYLLGYTLIVPAFRYFTKVNGAWEVDRAMLAANLATIQDLDRPVVVHLSATHFAYSGMELTRELAQDERNLQWTRDGPAHPFDYFNVPIIAWSLADQSAPVSVLRRQLFHAAIDALCELPAAAQQRIIGVSVLGETHEVFRNLGNGPTYAIPTSELTDYSPMMAHGFRAWLQQRYGTIARLNQELGASFASFEAIQPPSRDIRSEVLNGYFDHMDSYAHGILPIYGWVHDQRRRPLEVRIRLNGREIGSADLGLTRTDVSEARPDLPANLGYRYDLDFRAIGYGSHAVEVTASAGGGEPLLVARRTVVHIDRTQGAPQPVPYVGTPPRPLSVDSQIIGGIDGPDPVQSVFYNPLADLWLQFRNLVVRNYVDQFARIAGKSCIPASKVFSHQITPRLYGSWNSDVLAVDASLRPSASYLPGVTLYGGGAVGGAFNAMKQRLGWARYGVGELHPLVPMRDEDYAAMFELHRRGGAAYVAPYYMNLLPAAPGTGENLDRFLIAPGNTRYGSDRFHRGIAAAMQR